MLEVSKVSSVQDTVDSSDAMISVVTEEQTAQGSGSLSSRAELELSLQIPVEMSAKWVDEPLTPFSPTIEPKSHSLECGPLPVERKLSRRQSRRSSTSNTTPPEEASQKRKKSSSCSTTISKMSSTASLDSSQHIAFRGIRAFRKPRKSVLLPSLSVSSRRSSNAQLASIRNKFQPSERNDPWMTMCFISKVKKAPDKPVISVGEVELTPEEKAAAEKKRKRGMLLRAIAQAGRFASTVGKKTRPSIKKDATFWLKLAMKNTKEDTSPSMVLPTASDLCDLPKDLKETFNAMAMEALKKYLYPKLLIWKHRMDSQRKLAVVDNPPVMTVAILQKQAMFQHWPEPLLQEVIERLVLASYDKNDFIIHEDERSGSGIYFVMTGKVVVLKKKDRHCKAIGGKNAHVLVTLNPIICVGEFSFLTEEPRMASIRALCRVDCLVLKKQDFSYFVDQLSKDVFKSVIEVAFATRNSNMHLSYPLNESVIRQSPIFQPCSSEMLTELTAAATPYCVPKNFRICSADEPATKLFFLRNGKCGIVRSIRDSDTVVQTLRSPCVIGESGVIHTGPYGETVVTQSTCDFWVLPKEAFDKSLRRHRSIESLMMSEARNQRQRQLAHQQNLFRGCIHNIPFLPKMCSKEQQRELVWSFQAHVYKPLTVICSTTQFADRLIILYKGTCKVGDNALWRQGECIGFSCIVPHKWACKVVACGVVECLELPLFLYSEFLTRHNLKKRLSLHIKHLLFPYAFPAADVQNSQGYINAKSPVMYPVSPSSKVNLTEEGYSPKHYSHLEYLNKGKLPVIATAAACKEGTTTMNKRSWIRHGTQLWMRKHERRHPGDASADPLEALRSVGKVARKSKKAEESDAEVVKVVEPWRAFLN